MSFLKKKEKWRNLREYYTRDEIPTRNGDEVPSCTMDETLKKREREREREKRLSAKMLTGNNIVLSSSVDN